MRVGHILVAAALTAGCESSTELALGPQSRVSDFAAATPTEITGIIGAEVTPVPAVRVTDERGQPVAGVAVRFSVGPGGGALAEASVYTDALGLATPGRWVLGTTLGDYSLTAESTGLVPITFTAHAVPGVVPCDGTCPALLFVRNGVIYKRSGDGGAEAAVTEGIQPAWSPDGQEIAFVRQTPDLASSIYMMDSEGSNIVRRTEARLVRGLWGGLHSPTWAPDGSKLAVASGGVYEGEVFVLPAADDGEGSTFLTASAGSPAWSPDGSLIAFVSLSGDDGYHAIHVMSPDGSGVREVAPRDPGGIYRLTWSPDGGRIAFSKCALDGCDIYTVTLGGAGLTRLTHGGLYHTPAWSPDGNWIAVTRWSAGAQPSIAVVPAEGGHPVTIVEAGSFPAWRP